MPLIDKESMNRVVSACRLCSRQQLREAGVSEPKDLGTEIYLLNAQASGLTASPTFVARHANYKPTELFHALDRVIAELGPTDSPLALLLRRRHGEIAVEMIRSSKEFFAAEYAA